MTVIGPPGGLADVSGLRLGDVVQQVNNQPVAAVEDMEAALGQIESDQPREVIFFVWRSNKTLFVNIKAPWQ